MHICIHQSWVYHEAMNYTQSRAFLITHGEHVPSVSKGKNKTPAFESDDEVKNSV